jgi:hypothetical protein
VIGFIVKAGRIIPWDNMEWFLLCTTPPIRDGLSSQQINVGY